MMDFQFLRDWTVLFDKSRTATIAPGILKSNPKAMQVLYILSSINACGWYRLLQLAWAINTEHYDDINITITNWCSAQLYQNPHFKIIGTQRVYEPHIYQVMQEQNPNIVYTFELDDDLSNLAPDNPAYDAFMNADAQRVLNNMTKAADYVTVSTDVLKTTLQNKNKNVRVIPNGIDLSIYGNLNDLPRNYETDDVVIGWTGGHSHGEDLQQIISAIKEILNKYPKVKFLFGGFGTFEGFNDLPPDRFQRFDWTKNLYEHYSRLYNIDIGLCPLKDSEFNSNKSNLKYIEMAGLGIPVIASDVPAYNRTITDGQDGLLVSPKGKCHLRWVKALEKLIQDKALRKRIGMAGKELVKRKFDQRIMAKQTANWYKKIVDEKLKKGISSMVISKPQVDKISVVVPCFNQEKYIEETLQSIKANSKTMEFEVIVVDDASTDKSVEVIQNYIDKEKDMDIRLLKQDKNMGVSAARNRGISEAKYKFIVCVDGDDILPTNYLKANYNNITSNNLDVSYTSSTCFDSSDKIYDWPEYSEEKIRKGPFINCSAMFRKSLWEKVGGFDEGMSLGWEDYEFWLRIAKRTKRIGKCLESSLFWRVKGSSRTTVADKNLDAIKSYIKDKHKDWYLGV